MTEVGDSLEAFSVFLEVMITVNLVVAVEGVTHVTIWVYFKARANRISLQTGYGVRERRGVKVIPRFLS